MKYSESSHPLGFIEALPKPPASVLIEYYRNKYFQEPGGTYSPSYTESELAYFENVAHVAERTCKRVAPARTLLDLGCGEGYFSKAFRTFGWSVTCADFSDFGIKQHNPELLSCLTIGDVHDVIANMAETRQIFGLINLQNVLEHVVDPLPLLTSVREILAPNSVVRIRVPNDYSEFQAELVRKGYTTKTWFSPPEHLSYFNRSALLEVLRDCGYRVLSLQADFPIEMFLANPHSNYWKDRTLGKGAHLARVFVENFLISTDIDAYIRYSEAAGELGFGRELIVYGVPV